MGQVKYKTHLSQQENIEDAIKEIYENIMIHKAIILCISDSDCEELHQKLLAKHYPAGCLLLEHIEDEKSKYLTTLHAFKESPNHVLILSCNAFHKLHEDVMYNYILDSNHNLLISNDVPSYMVDEVMKKINKGHQQGFWNPHDEYYHIMWYMS